MQYIMPRRLGENVDVRAALEGASELVEPPHLAAGELPGAGVYPVFSLN
jgi:hypothetical protein